MNNDSASVAKALVRLYIKKHSLKNKLGSIKDSSRKAAAIHYYLYDHPKFYSLVLKSQFNTKRLMELI